MGSPKALLPFQGKTFLEHILGVAAAAGISETIVVVGHHREAITGAVTLPRVVFNPRYAEGMSTSVQAGIRALPEQATAAIVFLVDHPAISPDSVRKLLEAIDDNRIVLPVFNGRRGHPVAFGFGLFQEILELDSTQGLNTIVRRDPSRIVEVTVKDPGVLIDVDTPEQFKKLVSDSE